MRALVLTFELSLRRAQPTFASENISRGWLGGRKEEGILHLIERMVGYVSCMIVTRSVWHLDMSMRD